MKRLIEADKVKQVMKDCLKAQVNKTLKLVNGNEANDRINSCLEYNHDLLKAIDELPSAEPDTTTHGSNVVKKGENDEDRTSGDCISRQQAINKIKPWLEVKGYSWGELNMLRAVINELENMPSAQPETSCSEFPNNSDTISRKAAIDAVEKNACNTQRIMDAVNNLPPAQPERKTGRWIPDNTDYYRTKFICSVCGESEEVPTTGFGYGTMWGYCPNCGAKMERGEQE